MVCIPQRFILTAGITALSTLTLASTASAQYGQYPDDSYHQVSFQQASYRTPGYLSNDFNSLTNPPEILPYVPFDPDPLTNIRPYQAPMHNTRQDYQSRQTSYYQPASVQRTTPAYLSAERQRIIAAAQQQLGIKYRWGGNSPREGFDCSGFTKYSLKAVGAQIPRTAAQQSKASRTISRRDLKPGDMIFFKTSGRIVNHVGIYLGNGRFIHAASGGGRVTTDDLRKSYWQKRLHKYGTFLS
ncbi:MAG: C40 family peptidase [Thiolinea sp.]